jgi:ferredoxin
MTLMDEFIQAFQVPPAMSPHIHLVVDEREMELIVQMRGRAFSARDVAKSLQMSGADAEAFLARAFSRGIVEKESDENRDRFKGATFYRRMDPLAMYGNWGAIPVEVRTELIDWQLREFVDLWLPVIEEMRQDPDAYRKIPNRDVLLLDEALEQVEAATEHVVVPCDCRAIVMACDRLSDVCIRLDEGAQLTLEKGHGRPITKEECKAIVIDAHRAGLMHTGRRAWREHGMFGFCNCCVCDCYPFRGSMVVGLEKQWPRSHHIAQRDLANCHQCGLCAKRCQFDAFYRDGTIVQVNGRRRKNVAFDADKCWGCGICASACPNGAIHMLPLAGSEHEGAA